MNNSKKFTSAQLKRFRFFREKGFSIKEARRLAKMTSNEMADEIRYELNRQQKRKTHKRHAGTFVRSEALPHRGILLEDDEL